MVRVSASVTRNGSHRDRDVRVVDPAVVPGRALAAQVVHRAAQRQPFQRAAQSAFGPHHPDQTGDRADGFLVRQEIGPAEHVEQVERALLVGGVGEVVHADHHDHRLQLRRRIHRQRPLRETEVAAACRGEASVEPVLGAKPGDGVLSVVRFADAWHEGAAGAEGAPSALQQDVVATFGVKLGRQQGVRESATVRAPDQDGGNGLGGHRDVVIGEQGHAVPHRHLDLPYDPHPVAPRRQPPLPPGSRTHHALDRSEWLCVAGAAHESPWS